MEDASDPETAGEFTRLDRAESLRLLATVPAGRLIFTVNALPAVRLMNFAVTDGLIVMRTAAESTVARKLDEMIVTFEVDELDAGSCSGWSVTVTGRAALVTDPAQAARYRQVPLVPWAAGSRDQFVTITMDLAEGRRVRRPPPIGGDPADRWQAPADGLSREMDSDAADHGERPAAEQADAARQNT